ncbi:hypothetical protein TrRE_jg3326 [Triparma retinervis]|uniref:U-box domain-containing protein n=1 Tax=Triparma retinervis TaxID=2557542 RepID=A0A9W7ANE1_9STRA|nr:hypothetical protein TrRE_jg3326 [Triparma retinervis]
MDISDDSMNALCCPITLSCMSDPVICTSDGHTYERSAITNWFSSNDTSPMSGEKIGDGCMLIPNHALRNAIDEFRERNGGGEKGGGGSTVARLGPTRVDMKGKEECKEEGGSSVGSGGSSVDTRVRKGSWFSMGRKSSPARAPAPASRSSFPATNDTFSEGMGKAKLTKNALDAIGGGEAVGTFAIMQKKINEQERRDSERRSSADDCAAAAAGDIGVGFGLALGGSSRDASERRFLAQRRTRDHIIVAGKPLTATSSMGTAGIFQHVQPYPTHLKSDGDPNITPSGYKVMSCSGASQFPGLLATAGMGKEVKLWIHRPIDDGSTVKKGGKKEGRFSFSSFLRRTKDDEDLDAAGSGGFWENFQSLTGSKDWLNDVKFSSDASLVLAGGRAGSMHLWRSPGMGPLAGEWENACNIQRAHSGGEFNAGVVKSVALHPSKRMAYSGGMDWDLKAWDVAEGTGLCNGRAMGNGGNKHSAPINDIAMSERNGLLATAGDDGKVLIWDERCKEGGDCITKLQVSEKPCSGCMFQPYGINGGGNWIITSDEEGCIKVWDLRKWELSRVIYDSRKVHQGDSYGSSGSWEGGSKVDLFKDVQISSEGWVCAVTEPGHLYTWDPSKNWVMSRQPTRVKATSLTISRVLA